MDWTDFVMIGGLCTIIAAFAFFFFYILPRTKMIQPRSAYEERFNCLRDLCSAAGLAGCVLVSIATFVNSTHHPALSLAVLAIWVWCSGFFVGRASLHWRRWTDDRNLAR